MRRIRFRFFSFVLCVGELSFLRRDQHNTLCWSSLSFFRCHQRLVRQQRIKHRSTRVHPLQSDTKDPLFARFVRVISVRVCACVLVKLAHESITRLSSAVSPASPLFVVLPLSFSSVLSVCVIRLLFFIPHVKQTVTKNTVLFSERPEKTR